MENDNLKEISYPFDFTADETVFEEDPILNDDDLIVGVGAVLFSVARSDGSVCYEEVERIVTELAYRASHKKTSHLPNEISTYLSLAADISNDPELLKQALEAIASSLGHEECAIVLNVAKEIAKADGKVTENEARQLLELARELL